MKKILIGFAGVIILAFVAVLFINAREGTQGVNKVQTEVKSDASNGPCMMQCNHSTVSKAQSCDPEKCKNAGCDQTNCKGNCEKAKEAKACNPATCPGHKNVPAVK